MPNPKIWIITGAAREIGLEIARAVLASGDTVVATVRSHPEELRARFESPNLHVAVLAASQKSSLAAFLLGPVDVSPLIGQRP